MKKILTSIGVSVGLIGFFAPSALAEVQPGIRIVDEVISIGDGVFDVKREARLNTNRANEYYVFTDYLQISAWDGKVLERCRQEMKRAEDHDGDGKWAVEILKEDGSCIKEKTRFDIIKPLEDWRIEGDAMKMGRRQLATEDFLRERMRNMTGGERRICEHSQNDGQIAGCNLVSEDKELVLAGDPVANDKHVLIPILTGETGKRDEESAFLWVAMGRQYWKP